jgi:ribonuclease BN (tRNA processing enzyme)
MRASPACSRPSHAVTATRSWKLTAGHAVHVQPYLECLAFRLDTEDGSLCYSGDSGATDSIVELPGGATSSYT